MSSIREKILTLLSVNIKAEIQNLNEDETNDEQKWKTSRKGRVTQYKGKGGGGGGENIKAAKTKKQNKITKGKE